MHSSCHERLGPLTKIHRYAQEQLRRGALTASERATVTLTASVELGCDDCVDRDYQQSVRAKVPRDELEYIVSKHEPANTRLRALVRATRVLLGTRGRLDADQWRELDAAGIERTQLCTIIALIAVTVLVNYGAHVEGETHGRRDDD